MSVPASSMPSPLDLALDRYLAHAGYATASALDGAKALELVQTFAPDLVVLDLMLPRINGLEICRLLRETWCSLGVLAVVGTVAFGLPAIDRAVPGTRPVPPDQAYTSWFASVSSAVSCS